MLMITYEALAVQLYTKHACDYSVSIVYFVPSHVHLYMYIDNGRACVELIHWLLQSAYLNLKAFLQKLIV